jgi:hypothetical protein
VFMLKAPAAEKERVKPTFYPKLGKR